MSLLDDLEDAANRKPRLPEWLIARTPEERKAIEQAMGNPAVSDDALVAIVRKYGGATTRTTVADFREPYL